MAGGGDDRRATQTPSPPEDVELLLQSVRRFRQAGAPGCLFLHIDGGPTLLPGAIGLGLALFAFMFGFATIAGYALVFGLLISFWLYAFAPPPSFEAVVAGWFVQRRNWFRERSLPLTAVSRAERIDIRDRNGRPRRSVFVLHAMAIDIGDAGTGDAPAAPEPVRIQCGSARVADALGKALIEAGVGVPEPVAAGVVPRRRRGGRSRNAGSRK
jgi:hypothetical protein